MKYYKPLKDETPLESDFRDEDRRPNRLRIETERKDSGGEDCDSTRVGAILDLLSSKNSDFNANFNLTNGALNVLSKDVSQALFIKARKLLNPGIFFRWVIHLYAERKMIVFFGIHFVSTMIIWAHFALIKFESQRETVPMDANRYWWKVITPPLEFGSMHAILFQMALLPLTMSRLSIASLSESFVDKLIPLNRTLRMHIHLGYTMTIIVILATIFFFTFFGILCSDGEEKFCAKFTSEIMITGYCILGSLLVIGGTSYYRHKIPYELFYAVHHIVFIMYFITIAHTFDVQQRKGMANRSQTFKWFSSTLLFYICDRTAMRLNHNYSTKLVASSTVSQSNGSRMIILKVDRPILFRFKPGQYAFLQISSIDNQWHPFSIASGPDSYNLEFYIEVCSDKSWTQKLWEILEQTQEQDNFGLRLSIDIMGPYGTSLAKTDDFSHVLAIGAGTGIVPILSLLKHHVQKLLQFEPTKYLQGLEELESKIQLVELAMEEQKGSLADRAISTCILDRSPRRVRKDQLSDSILEGIKLQDSLESQRDLEQNMAKMKKQAYLATRSLYGTVLLGMTPVLGVALLGLTISWNMMPINHYSVMFEVLQAFTCLFQFIYFLVSIFIWDATTILTYIDAVLCVIAPLADVYWFQAYRDNRALNSFETNLFCLLIGYMTFRLWIRAVQPNHKSWKNHVKSHASVSTWDRLEVVWTTRSASQVSNVLPDLLKIWNSLVDAWGHENARKVCRISIYVTDTDPTACELLPSRDNTLDISFSRLDIPLKIESHTMDMIMNRQCSYSLLAFCGSDRLAREILYHKISNDMITAITGNKKHQMEFVSESYGGPSKDASNSDSVIKQSFTDSSEGSSP